MAPTMPQAKNRDGVTVGAACKAAHHVVASAVDGFSNLSVGELADLWHARGHAPLVVDEDRKRYVEIRLSETTAVHDAGRQCRIAGPVTDDAVRAVLLKASSDWDTKIHIVNWPRGDADKLHVAATRMGIIVSGQSASADAGAEMTRDADRERMAADDVIKGMAMLAYAEGRSATGTGPAVRAFVNRNPGVARELAGCLPLDLAMFLRVAETEGACILQLNSKAGKSILRPKPGDTPGLAMGGAS